MVHYNKDTTEDGMKERICASLGLPFDTEVEIRKKDGLSPIKPLLPSSFHDGAEYVATTVGPIGTNYVSPNYALGLLAIKLKTPYVYYFGTKNAVFGNAILSRVPFEKTNAAHLYIKKTLSESQQYTVRLLLSVLVVIPETSQRLWVSCTHLDHISEDSRMEQILHMDAELSKLQGKPSWIEASKLTDKVEDLKAQLFAEGVSDLAEKVSDSITGDCVDILPGVVIGDFN
ncbi:hypothetical protein ADUPG1_011032, partial [Aduncisulcus paluster]